tara:strand:+ start:4863 stop:5999 length:1137 start_codon:yes stop_codon:yes gene_type:complete
MNIFRAVKGRQVLLPVVGKTLTSAKGTYTVDASNAAAGVGVAFTVTVAGTAVSVTTGATTAATTAAITAAISGAGIASITVSDDGASVVTVTAATAGAAGNDITITSGDANVVASGATLSGAGTGLTLSGLTVAATSGSSRLADPGTTLQLALSEVDSTNLPGWYELRVIPNAPGLIYLTASAGTYSESFIIQVSHQDLDLLGSKQAGYEGDYIFTAKDGSDNAIEGASVRVYDSAGTSLVTRAITNSSGKCTFALPVGTYNVRTFKTGYDFTSANPTEITVTANSKNSPVITELVPSSIAAGAVLVIKGTYFHASSSEVMFGSTAVSATSVSDSGDVLTVTVPSGSDTAVTIKVRKPDPDDSSSYLTSGSLTLTRSE